MAALTDVDGRVPLTILAERFRDFFVARSVQNKVEENPNIVEPGSLSRKTVRAWEALIRKQPVHYLTESFVIDEVNSVRWAPRIWCQWNADLKHEIVAACPNRLIRYFERHVPGGY